MWRLLLIDMKEYNCCILFDKNNENVLFCERMKDPYKGLLNFVGGKKEKNENSEEAAYRELFEETGILKKDVELKYFMGIDYAFLDYSLKLYYGILKTDIVLKEELNPLKWLPIEQDYENVEKFAGEQNIGHIIRMALKCIESNS